ncbi:hypothetical protein [Luteimonas sp. R10]|uniref:hypothetical protein n=1 Tax=Luteimonas sp. R10 TaxID=3108176 RepID=UPI003087824E|nr:hypothetical protein U3649_13400 [Luteimonas sp. R10]
MTMKLPVSALAVLVLVACTPVARSDGHATGKDITRRMDPCSTADHEIRMAIEVGDDRHASICRVDGLGDCLYSFEFGKTFIHASLDLNFDGREDYLIKDFSGAYGMHDVVHFMGFTSCPGGFSVKVLDDFFTDVRPREARGTWADLQVSRACFDEGKGETGTRKYTVAFDSARSAYGPPDGNPALTEYCGPEELALPLTPAHE